MRTAQLATFVGLVVVLALYVMWNWAAIGPPIAAALAALR